MEPSAQPEGRVRRLWPSDVAAYRTHLLRLDRMARYSRFASIIADETIARHAEKCFGPDCLVYGYFVAGDLRAAAELHVLEPGMKVYTGQGEAAFSVEAPWRHKGVGSLLMERVLRAARNRGLTRIVITCLSQNFAMQGLARKFGADLKFQRDEVSGRFTVHLPTAQSLFKELFDDSLGFATAVLDVQKRILAPAGTQRDRSAA